MFVTPLGVRAEKGACQHCPSAFPWRRHLHTAETKIDRPYISCAEAARQLRTTPWFVRSLALSGRLKTLIRPGQPLRFSRADIEALKREMVGTEQ